VLNEDVIADILAATRAMPSWKDGGHQLDWRKKRSRNMFPLLAYKILVLDFYPCMYDDPSIGS
jgi:hypothetical protein